MYIQKIKIRNYRNFDDFEMEFQEGLNVIVGPNNSGKTGLLYAIDILSNPNRVTFDDFNKNNLQRFVEKEYKKYPPEISIEYTIHHTINETDTEDESIIKLLSFLGMNEIKENKVAGSTSYDIVGIVKATFSLSEKKCDEYEATMKEINDLEAFLFKFEGFFDNYSWNYSNSVSETTIERKEAVGIFDINFISAERTSDEVNSEARKELDHFSKSVNNADTIRKFNKTIKEEMGKVFKDSIDKVSVLFSNENNSIGLKKGNITIDPKLDVEMNFSDAYQTQVLDTKSNAHIPLENNGLGYNNLINIYMLIKLNEVRKGKDFRILCLEEPEAHLHPAMQYKLFKYLSELDAEKKLNQQIFVTTHSSNISAVAGIDRMYMISYDRENNGSECRQQSLAKQFSIIRKQDATETEKANENRIADEKTKAKKHFTKFLDVTRSDMLFADKIILVEGIAERLLLPSFMDSCGCSYEDEHVAIVEIGGKHFEHFIELFNKNSIKKKVLCITDKDFNWFSSSEKKGDYDSYVVPHIKKLNDRFKIDNLRIVTQNAGGQTFEDELFLTNSVNGDVEKVILGIVLPDTLKKLLNEQGIDYDKWHVRKDEINSNTKKRVDYLFDEIDDKISKDSINSDFYKMLFFSQLFLIYAQNKKGEVALEILSSQISFNGVNSDLMSVFSVPAYIKEGLEWLNK